MVKIRGARQKDFYPVLPLLQQIFPDIELEEVGLSDVFRQFLVQRDAEIFILEIEDKPVALMTLTFRLSLFHKGKTMTIGDLIVDEHYRGQGIGTKLARYAEKVAKQKKCKCIELNSGFDRLEAHHFWKNLGYLKIGYHFHKD